MQFEVETKSLRQAMRTIAAVIATAEVDKSQVCEAKITADNGQVFVESGRSNVYLRLCVTTIKVNTEGFAFIDVGVISKLKWLGKNVIMTFTNNRINFQCGRQKGNLDIIPQAQIPIPETEIKTPWRFDKKTLLYHISRTVLTDGLEGALVAHLSYDDSLLAVATTDRYRAVLTKGPVDTGNLEGSLELILPAGLLANLVDQITEEFVYLGVDQSTLRLISESGNIEIRHPLLNREDHGMLLQLVAGMEAISVDTARSSFEVDGAVLTEHLNAVSSVVPSQTQHPKIEIHLDLDTSTVKFRMHSNLGECESDFECFITKAEVSPFLVDAAHLAECLSKMPKGDLRISFHQGNGNFAHFTPVAEPTPIYLIPLAQD